MKSPGSNVALTIINGAETPLGRAIVERISHSDRSVVVSEPGELVDNTAVTAVLLAPGRGPDVDGTELGGADPDQGTAWLRTLARLEVTHVIVLSSATVYGAWPDNPMPLTEDAPVRPNPEAEFAWDALQLEQGALQWAEQRKGVKVTIVRPTLVISPDPDRAGSTVTDRASGTWLERSLWHTPTAKFGDADPHGQFLSRSDLVEAIAHLIEHSDGGVYNVAPDGWLAVARQVELVGRGGRVRISERLARRVAVFRWVFQLTSTPPDVLPYTMHSWVIANDRLTATGWEPASTNEETFVSATRAGWWASMHGRRRQEVALGILLVSFGVVVAITVALFRSARRPIVDL